VIDPGASGHEAPCRTNQLQKPGYVARYGSLHEHLLLLIEIKDDKYLPLLRIKFKSFPSEAV
jgi:hypothetical protein